MLEGFKKLTDKNCFMQNVNFIGNQISPFQSEFFSMQIDGEVEVYVDQYYGNCYQSPLLDSGEIYGATNLFPKSEMDVLENNGYLRVPFRRIPRRIIKSRNELTQITSYIREKTAAPLLFRGQTREYLLDRGIETNRRLFGDVESLEPSLLPSATRAGTDLQDVHPKWMQVIQLYFASHKTTSAMSVDRFEILNKLHGSYNLSIGASALAQHYGMPTCGVDATDSLDTALFFALGVESNKHDSLAVIYVLDSDQRYCHSLNETGFDPQMFLRPSRQGAHFLHTGWGYRQNSAASEILIALYFDPNSDWGKVDQASNLFPSENEDDFVSFLGALKTAQLKGSLSEYLETANI